MLVQAEHRSPTQNSDIYGVCIAVMLLAGKLESGSSGQLFIKAWACSWCHGASPSELNHYPGTHPLISGANEPNLKLIGWDSDFAQGRLWHARMVRNSNLRILMEMSRSYWFHFDNKEENAFFLVIIENSYVQKSGLYVLNPSVTTYT
jgi:hypothetical protein